MTPGEIAEETGIPRPSVYRLTEALAQARLTTTLPDSRVRLANAGCGWPTPPARP